MKIFEFDFYDTYENKHQYVSVLANSEEEAMELLKQDSIFQYNIKNPDINFQGLFDIHELNKPKVLW